MSDRTHLEVVQGFYETLGRGDIPAVLDMFPDDVGWIYQGPPVIPFAGTRRGRDGVAEFFTLLGETFAYEQFKPREFIAHGETVVVLGFERSRILSTGHTIDQEWAHVFTFLNDKITKVRSFEDTGTLANALAPTES
jgi:uncharacterized protein